MAKVVVEAPSGEPFEFDVPDGGSLLKACEAHGAPIPFRCRSASCGTCCVDVRSGATQTAAPRSKELAMLDILDAPSTHRLACCIVLRPGDGILRVRPVQAK